MLIVFVDSSVGILLECAAGIHVLHTARACCCSECERETMRPLFVLLELPCWWIEHTHTHTHKAE